jgi:hypothetical protein
MPKISTYTAVTPTMDDYVVGTDVDNGSATKSFVFDKITELINGGTVPATTTDPGKKGQIAANATHLYICVATDTWRRVALSTF